MEYENTRQRRRNPINRNNMFVGNEDFQLEMSIGLDYVEQDMNQTVILYQVDLDRTKVNDIYVESKKDGIKFLPPIELPVVYEIEDGELKSYDKKHSAAAYVKTGNLVFGVYEQTLEENECDIKRGDYIGVQVTPERIEYFTVADDGRVNYSNKQSYYGIRPFYRKVVCNQVDANEFNG